MTTRARRIAIVLLAAALVGAGRSAATAQMHEPDASAVEAFTELVDTYRLRSRTDSDSQRVGSRSRR